jgi:copper chaperone CopZ
MRKTIKLRDLDCANCASKIEDAVSKLEGVISVNVNFIGQRMVIETPDDSFGSILTQVKKTANKIEPDLVFLD